MEINELKKSFRSLKNNSRAPIFLEEIMNDIGIIIQARTGSARLPGKTLLPFFEDKSILDIIIENIQNHFRGKIIIATSQNMQDEKIVEIAKRNKVLWFRGNEENVLERFIDAAKNFGLNYIIRICGDNPFISPSHLNELIEIYSENPCDYLSYSLHDSTPVIKSSLGFFAEIVSLDALIKVAELTEEKQYREHVTNFIYAHPDLFNVKLIPLPFFFEDKKYARLTVDTKNDFDNAKKIYAQLKHQNKEINPENCCEIINEDSEMKDSMITEIEKNKK